MAVNSTKRLFLTSLLLSMSLLGHVSVQADDAISTVKDLRKLKQQAENHGVPVVLLFTSEDCVYCKAIKENYLLPMSKTAQYKTKVLFKQLFIDEFAYLRNGNGELVAGDQVALKYDVDVTPTILFINADGKELSERIVGISGFDYFDKLLEVHIAQAIDTYVQ